MEPRAEGLKKCSVGIQESSSESDMETEFENDDSGDDKSDGCAECLFCTVFSHDQKKMDSLFEVLSLGARRLWGEEDYFAFKKKCKIVRCIMKNLLPHIRAPFVF